MELLTLSGYLDEECKKPIPHSSYQVMINPETIDRQRKDNATEALKSNTNNLYDALRFNLVIDCTGIVDSKRTNMTSEIAALEKVFYTVDGGIQHLNFIKIQWGENTLFTGQLNYFDTTYTLFKPNGNPLRATIVLVFTRPFTTKKAIKI